jgi:hypothetical protein
MPLTGQQQETFLHAIVREFDRSGLEAVVTLRLGEHLSNIVDEGPLKQVVFDLIHWAQQHGRTKELIRALQRERPYNRQFQATLDKLLQSLDRQDTSPEGSENEPRKLKYYVVNIFYATDRQATAPETRRGASGMLMIGLWTGLATIIVSVIKIFVSNDKAVALLNICSIIGTILTLFFLFWSASLHFWPKPKLEVLEKAYGPNRGGGGLRYGVCQVSIPWDHTIGKLESPVFLKLEYVEDPTKHVVLRGVTEQSSDAFYRNLRQTIQRAGKQVKQALVFVHGFNVSFEGAARRTAQLRYDLKFKGAPIFYSWPSQHAILDYAVDETNVEWTVPHLEQFLHEIAANSGAEKIYLIAHSMGNRCLTNALRRLKMPTSPSRVFREVILTAPDIDADTFKNDIAPAILQEANASHSTLHQEIKLWSYRSVYMVFRGQETLAMES